MEYIPFGNYSAQGRSSSGNILMNEGSELDTIPNSKDFDISAKVTEFKELKGEIFACGTCLKMRGKEESKVCPISTMSDLLKMIEISDKVLVFWLE